MFRIRTLLCAASAAFGLTLGFNVSAATLTLNVDACDSFSLNNGVITCNTSGGTGPTPSCSLSSTTTTPTVGDTATLTMSCSNFGANTQYSWSAGCTSNPAANKCAVTSTTPATIPISATANDGTNNITKGPVNVTFSSAGTPTPGVPASCDDGTKTVKAGTIDGFDGLPNGIDNFGKGQTAYFVVKVPNMQANAPVGLAWLSIGAGADNVVRQVYASKTSVCDTAGVLSTRATNGTIYGTVNGGTSGVAGARLNMMPGETWFIIFKNLKKDGSQSCTAGFCPIYIKPQSLS